jgi:CO/xanthine dehydrogenase Mo-binding subunit
LADEAGAKAAMLVSRSHHALLRAITPGMIFGLREYTALRRATVLGLEPALRRAATREMLIAAAAAAWDVPASQCRVENSVVTHVPSRRKTTYGKVAETGRSSRRRPT